MERLRQKKRGGGVGEGSVWSGRGCVWNSALLSVTSESSAVLSIHSRLSLPVCLCFPPPDLKTIAQLLFTILDKVEPSGLKFRVHVVPLGQDTCNVFHSSPFPLQIPDKFYTPFPLQISVLAKRKTQQQTWKRNEWEPNGNRLFFFCPMRSWLILETKQKKKPHHIELISRKPSHSRCIPLLSLAILPATANPARSDEEWKVVNRKWHVANGKHRRCVTHHLQPSDVYSIAYEKSTVQPGGCEIWRL